jgi:hypothetical protein
MSEPQPDLTPPPGGEEHGTPTRWADRSEMEANYPYFKAAVYGWLREKALREVPPLSDQDLEALVEETGAQPLKDFIDEL